MYLIHISVSSKKEKREMKDENFKYQMIAIQALDKKYGFCPSPQQVKLLESDGEGTYILFRVDGHEYRCENGMIVNIEDRKKSTEVLDEYFQMYFEALKAKNAAEKKLEESQKLADQWFKTARKYQAELEEHKAAWATLRRMMNK